MFCAGCRAVRRADRLSVESRPRSNPSSPSSPPEPTAFDAVKKKVFIYGANGKTQSSDKIEPPHVAFNASAGPEGGLPHR